MNRMKLCLIGIAALTGCASWRLPERESARAALVFSTRAMVDLNEVCAEVVRGIASKSLAVSTAHKCSVSTRGVLSALVDADKALESGDSSSLACTASNALTAMRGLIKIIDASEKTVPKASLDAVQLLSAIVGIVGGCDAR